MNLNGLSVSHLKAMTPEDLDLLRRMLEEAAKEQRLQVKVAQIEAWEATNPKFTRQEVVDDWNGKRFYYNNGLCLAIYPDDPISYGMALDMGRPYDCHVWHGESEDIQDGLDGFKQYLNRQKDRAQRDLAQFEDMCRRIGASQ